MTISWQVRLNLKESPVVLCALVKIVLFTLTVVVAFVGLMRVIDGNGYGITAVTMLVIYVKYSLVASLIVTGFYYAIVIRSVGEVLTISYTMDRCGIAYEILRTEEEGNNVWVTMVARLITSYKNCMYLSFKMVDRVTLKREKKSVIFRQRNLIKHCIFLDEEIYEEQVQILKGNLTCDVVFSEV